MGDFLSCFKEKKPVIGMIHTKGTDDRDVMERAKREIELYVENGVDGIIVETYFGNYNQVEMELEYIKQSKIPIPYGVNLSLIHILSIQAQVVNLIRDIQKETGTAYLFIAHDLSMVKYISDRIGVMHMGHLLETGSKDEIFSNPVHPYTKSLLSAIPHPNPHVEKERVALHYDYFSSGIDYTKGNEHLVDGTHYVLATDQEFDLWTAPADIEKAVVSL